MPMIDLFDRRDPACRRPIDPALMTLIAEHLRVDPTRDYPLAVLATRYRPHSAPHSADSFTLVFVHGVGLHKETWEISIEKLFESCAADPAGPQIRECISIDVPNHGESAIVNEAVLKQHYGDQWPTREIARGLHAFLSLGLSSHGSFDLRNHKLVAVGHSIGAAAIFLLRDIQPRIYFHALIAIEAGISIRDFPDTFARSAALNAWSWLRHDVWINRDAARKELSKSPVYKMWDPRVFELYLKYGLRKHPAAKYDPPFSFDGVTTSLTKEQETACFRSPHLVVDAMDAYTVSTREGPVHLAYGTVYDVGTPALQALLLDTSKGRIPASVSTIEGAGHLAPQHKPEQVAEVIYEILCGRAPKPAEFLRKRGKTKAQL